jgi:hypothetical protein
METKYYIGYCSDKPEGELFGCDTGETIEQLEQSSGYESVDGPYTYQEAKDILAG